MGGQPDNVTQTTKVELTPEQKELQKLALGQIRPLFGEDGSTSVSLPNLPGFNAAQTGAQTGALEKAGQGGILDQLSGQLGSAQSFLLGDVLDVNSNPYLQSAIDAAIRPLTEQYQSTVVPSLRTDAISAGALGDPKQQIAAQTAANSYQRQVGDTAAGIASNAYGQGLDALGRAIALAPQTNQQILFPETVQEAVGTQQRAEDIAQSERGFAQETLPLSLGVQLLNAAAGAPGGSTTSTVQGAGGGGGLTSLLGTGLSAISLLAGIPGLF